jgi:hypothetical protein
LALDSGRCGARSPPLGWGDGPSQTGRTFGAKWVRLYSLPWVRGSTSLGGRCATAGRHSARPTTRSTRSLRTIRGMSGRWSTRLRRDGQRSTGAARDNSRTSAPDSLRANVRHRASRPERGAATGGCSPANSGPAVWSGGREIRTLGWFPISGFQDRRTRPLCEPSRPRPNGHCRTDSDRTPAREGSQPAPSRPAMLRSCRPNRF